MRRAGLALLAMAALVVVPPAGATTTTVTVDPSSVIGRINPALGGLNWTPGAQDDVAGLRPPLVRVDAYLNRASPEPGVLDLSEPLRHVAEIRSIGAEPLVILSYMPPWLGEPNAYGRDPTRVAPADMDAWEDLVYRAVTELAAAGARRFEAWNEPDVPVFWQDSPQAFAETAAASARAVARVEAASGVDLAFGGPAVAFPDPVYLAAFLAPFRDDPALPLDFVSWHYYGNYPFFGPEGAEEGVFPEQLEPAYPVVGRRNPLAHPANFGGGVEMMRRWTAAALAGSDRAEPGLVLDEWNVSAGGYDRRHDTHEGAAFDASVLMEMQDADLDASAVFRAKDTRTGVIGEHGIVEEDGARKPAWWTFWLWGRMRPFQVAATGSSDADGLWAIASRNRNHLTVLVASFSASAPTDRTIELDVDGWAPVAMRRIDARNHAGRRHALTATTFDLPAQSVALVELRPSR